MTPFVRAPDRPIAYYKHLRGLMAHRRPGAMPQLDKSKMKCNSPRAAPSWHSKKSVVKACSGGKERIIGFGDKSMTIKKSNPARRANFRARHNCAGKKDKMTAGYWSCKVRSHPTRPRGHPCRK